MFTGIMLFGSSVFAQVKVGDNPTSINPSAVLDAESTTKGVLPPRMTSSQRDAITSPATGLMIYNTTESCLQTNNGTPQAPVWECSSVKTGGDALLRFNDTRPYNYGTATGGYGLGYQQYSTVPNTEVIIPFSDYTFSKPASGTLSLTYSAFIDYAGGGGESWQHVEYRLYIDNELVGTQSFEHNPLEAASISITGYKTITAGNHTVQLRAFRLRNGATPNFQFQVYQNAYYASIQ